MSGIRMFGFRYYDEEPVDPDLPEHLGAVHRADWIHLIARMKTKGRKDVALMLASSASEDGSEVRPALRTIADMCDLHETSVSAHIKTLLELGMLVVKRPGGGRSNPTVYRLTRPLDLTTLPLWLDPDMKRVPAAAGLPAVETPASTQGNKRSSNADSPVPTLPIAAEAQGSNTYSPELTKGVSDAGETETPAPTLPFSPETPVPTQGYRPVDNFGEALNPSVLGPKPQCLHEGIAETPVPTLGDLLQADRTPDQNPGLLPQAVHSLGWRERAAEPAMLAALVGPPKPEPWISPAVPAAAAPHPGHAVSLPAPRTYAPEPPPAPRIIHGAATAVPTAEAAAAFAVLASLPGEGEWWRHAAARELRRDGIPDPSAQDLAIRAAAILRRTDLEKTA